MTDLIQYIVSFLLRLPKQSDAVKAIGYTADKNQFDAYRIVIIPSGLFDDNNYGKKASMPSFPLQEIEGMPFPYGNSLVEKVNSTLVIHADLIASSFFFLSRYEEWVRTDAVDVHGRFKGKESVAFKGGFIHRPIVDEYGRFLRQKLREQGIDVPEPQNKIHRIYLTHDIDLAFQYRSIRGLVGALIRSVKDRKNEIIPAIRVFFGDVKEDPLYSTYQFAMQKDAELQENIRTIFFFKSLIKKTIYDMPFYSLGSRDIQHLFFLCRQRSIDVALHPSYAAGEHPNLIGREKINLEKHSNVSIWFSRHHYLRLKCVTDMQYLVKNHISDDFSMGYPDVAGFRLGTCRSVRWINPATYTVTELVLHPLTAMDATLTDPKYMNLSKEKAFEYLCALIDTTKEHNGDVTLLWHTNKFLEETCREFYVKLINYLKK